MFGRTKQYAWAALLAALVGACDGPSEPPVPSVVQITSHADGALINETEPPETPVTFTGWATHKGRTLPGTALAWTVNGQSAGTGSSISAVLKEGENSVCLTATVERESDPVCIKVVVRPRTLIITKMLPTEGARIEQWGKLECLLEYRQEPPRNEEVRTDWVLDDVRAVECNSETPPQLMFRSPPALVTNSLALGEHTVRGCVEIVGRNVRTCETRRITVVKPLLLLFGSREPDDRGTIWSYSWRNGTFSRLFTRPSTNGTPDLSPDGTLIAFARDSRADGCGQINVYLANRDGSNERRLWGDCTVVGGGSFPRFSPDGRWVVFEAVEPRRADAEIGLVDTNGGNPELVRPTPWCEQDAFGPSSGFPCWGAISAPVNFNGDSNLIFSAVWYTATTRPNQCCNEWWGQDVIIGLNLVTRSYSRLWEGKIMKRSEDTSPFRFPDVFDISPDGKYLLISTWNSNTNLPRQVALMPINGGPPRFLTSVADGDADWPTFSPDGQEVCYVDNSPSTVIQCVDFEGKKTRRIIVPGLREVYTPSRWPRY